MEFEYTVLVVNMYSLGEDDLCVGYFSNETNFNSYKTSMKHNMSISLIKMYRHILPLCTLVLLLVLLNPVSYFHFGLFRNLMLLHCDKSKASSQNYLIQMPVHSPAPWTEKRAHI